MEAISEFGDIDDSRRRLASEMAQGYSYLEEGDVAYAKVTPCFENGKGLIARDLPAGRAFATTEVTVLRPGPRLDAGYLAWVLQSEDFKSRGEAHMTGAGGLRRVPDAFTASYPVPLPELGVQRAIADYLDHETAQVDAFIATSERLIHLLTERRSAVISRAITKGLNPTAPLKPSGVPWLGDIPAHWESIQVKHVGRAIIGLTYSPEEVVGSADEGTLVLRAGNIQQGRIVFEDSVYVSTPVPDRLRLRESDIVICARNGSAHLVGKNSVATSEVVGQTWGAFMAVLRSDINDFLRWVLNSPIFSASTGQFATTTINQLTSSTLHGLRFALPPESERRAISEYLDRAISDIDRAISMTRRSIGLARERRAALISAVVSGQREPRWEP
jgi:type I restriction enzyme S subunit